MHRDLAILCHAFPTGLTAGGFAFEVALAAAGAAPDWVQLTPRGRLNTRDGRTFSFDPEALVAAFNADGVNLPLDFEHESEHVKELGARPARGWIIALEARANGLFGRVEWLKDAADALAARQYRYISPTFWADKAGAAIRMKGAALVNSPALGMPALASAHHLHEVQMDKTLAQALGLPETATAAEAVVAVAALKAGVDPAKFVPIAQHEAATAALAEANGRLQAIETAAKTAKCAALIDDGVKAGKIAPAAKDHYLALAAADYDKTKALVDALPVIVAAGAEETGKAADPGAALTEVELATCTALGLTAEQFIASKKAA